MGKRRRDVLTLLGVAVSGTVAGCGAFHNYATKFAPDDGDAKDYFGGSVTLSGDGATALVVAGGDEAPNGEHDGSVYVFGRNGVTWTRTTKLTLDDGDRIDEFGVSVALSSDGTTALVGAFEEREPKRPLAGSAYVFDRSGATWTRTAKLALDDGDDGAYFGQSVALSSDGTTALVGADSADNPNGPGAGSAYVFDRSGDTWRQTTNLTPDDGDDNDAFGFTVELSGDGTTALLGAPGDENPNGSGAGSAYVFDRIEGSWSQTTKLAPDDGDDDDSFGLTVALSSDGTTALIGAPGDEDPNGPGAGSAYVFGRTEGAWRQTTELAPDDGDAFDRFGSAVALSSDGTTALVGAAGDEDPNGPGAGSAYVFDRIEGAWGQTTKLAPDDGDERDVFGGRVAVSGDGATALIGATSDDNSNGENAGSAYVFVL